MLAAFAGKRENTGHPHKDSSAGAGRHNRTPTQRATDPEVEKRRALVRRNKWTQARELCDLFDRENVPLPARWEDTGTKSWKELYAKFPDYRRKIDVIVSKDRKAN